MRWGVLAVLTAAGVVAASVAFAGDLPPGGTFLDDDGNVHEGAIEAIAAEGITKGCNPPANDLYCPSGTVTRGQMAAFLVRALGLADDGGGDLFIDDDGSVFEGDIDKLGTAGITRGCNPPANDRFCPDDPVTRGQMAAFLVRAFGYADDGGGDLFIDDDGSVFEGDIDKLGTAGVTKGCNPPANDRYCPTANVLRDQMASFLTRALDLDPMVPPPRPTTTTTTTTPPGDCSNVRITSINFDAPGNDNSNPNGEWVKLTNNGGTTAFMNGCWLHDRFQNHVYSFPDTFSLGSGVTVQLFSGCGADSATKLYWCTGAVWNNDGDTATLRNPDNSIIHERSG